MEKILLASRIFTPDDQVRFATFTGDFNPMHMDSLAARRTQAGAPAVHGMHSLLWLLDALAAGQHDLPMVATLKIRLTSMIHVGDRAEAFLVKLTGDTFRLEVTVNGTWAVLVGGTFGPLQPGGDWPGEGGELLSPSVPQTLLLEEMENLSGRLSHATPPEEAIRMFPHASRWLGPGRVASLGCTTRLVGMVVPGLHSIYGSLDVAACEDRDAAPHLSFRVADVDPHFRMINQQIHGGGLTGTIGCFARMPPVAQPSLASMADKVSPREFAGTTALIIGGSRGLGELTAKLVTAGGGRVIISYVVGRSEAEALAAECNAWGGDCRIHPYDALADAGLQLASLPEKPTHIYYFATPQIRRRRAGFFDPARFEEFNAFYVSGFERLVHAVLRVSADGITAFYPSTVAVDERPEGMAEYAMAKSAGEILCAEMNARLPGVRVVVNRLPLLPTDQNAIIQKLNTLDPLETMLPLIREVQGSMPERL